MFKGKDISNRMMCAEKYTFFCTTRETGEKKECVGRWSRQAKCHAIYGTLDHMMEGHLQVLHMKVNGQICVLDWSLCDNSGDRLKGQNLMQRNKSGSCCNQTVIVGIKRKGTWKKKRFIREKCGENNLLCLLGLWFRGWLSGVYNCFFPLLALTYALLWRCRNVGFNLVLWKQYRS